MLRHTPLRLARDVQADLTTARTDAISACRCRWEHKLDVAYTWASTR